MGKIGAIFAALRYGSSLSDPAVWKNRQTLINVLVGLLGALVVLLRWAGVNLEVSDASIAAIAGGIAAAVGLCINPYLTTATSTKVGLPPKPEPDPRPAGSGVRIASRANQADDPYRSSFGGD